MNKIMLSLISLLIISCHETTQKIEKVKAVSVEELEQQAISYYKDDPRAAIKIFEEIVQKARASSDFKKASQSNLNIASIYDEELNQKDQALKFGYESLSDCFTIKDTLQMANLYKYIGLLEGKLGRYQKAEENISTAIDLFAKKVHERGVAVCHINMAEVKWLAGEFSSSEQYFNKSKNFWISVANKSRIFDNNLLGIQLYGTTDDQVKHRALVEENSRIMKEEVIDEFLVNKFRRILNDQVD